jgi:hypothetical protein
MPRLGGVREIGDLDGVPTAEAEPCLIGVFAQPVAPDPVAVRAALSAIRSGHIGTQPEQVILKRRIGQDGQTTYAFAVVEMDLVSAERARESTHRAVPFYGEEVL